MKQERLINYRPALLMALGAMLGVLICSLFVNLIFFLSLSVIFLGISVFLIIKRKKAAVFTVAFLLCFITFFISASINSVKKEYINQTFIGRVTERGDGYAVLENVKSGEEKLEGRAYVETEIPLTEGTLITFKGSLEKTVVITSKSYSIYLYKNNFRYTGSVYFVEKTEKGYLLPDEWVRYRVKTALKQGMGDDIASISMALLFGDKSEMEQSTYDAIKASGLAHIFAVSGQHIAFLIAILAFCLKKAKRKTNFFVTICVIFFYTYLSGFSPSVTRAVLMAFCLLLGNLIGAPKDIISSIALTVFTVIFIKPFYLFEIGFLMSVTSVLGIILLYKPILHFFTKFLKGKIGNYLSSALSLSFSANIALLPILANSFSTAAIYFPIANLIALPIITVAFVYLVCLIPLFVIFPALAPLSVPSGWLLIAVKKLAIFVSSLPYSTISITMSVGIGLVYTFSYLLLSNYINIKKSVKYVTVISLWCVSFLAVLMLSV